MLIKQVLHWFQKPVQLSPQKSRTKETQRRQEIRAVIRQHCDPSWTLSQMVSTVAAITGRGARKQTVCDLRREWRAELAKGSPFVEIELRSIHAPVEIRLPYQLDPNPDLSLCLTRPQEAR